MSNLVIQATITNLQSQINTWSVSLTNNQNTVAGLMTQNTTLQQEIAEAQALISVLSNM